MMQMEDNTLRGGNRDSVYGVFRVYNLGQADMDLKIYIDPEDLRETNSLNFTAENWSVVPGFVPSQN